MDNIKTHNIDGNKLVEDLEKNKYWIIFKNYLGEEIKSEIPKDIFDTYIKFKNIYKKNQNEEKYNIITKKGKLLENVVLPKKILELLSEELITQL